MSSNRHPFFVDSERTETFLINGNKICWVHRSDRNGDVILRKEWEDGRIEWFENGKLHNENGYAVLTSDGDEEYWLNGELRWSWLKYKDDFENPLNRDIDDPEFDFENTPYTKRLKDGTKVWYQGPNWFVRLEKDGSKLFCRNDYKGDWYVERAVRPDGSLEIFSDGEFIIKFKDGKYDYDAFQKAYKKRVKEYGEICPKYMSEDDFCKLRHNRFVKKVQVCFILIVSVPVLICSLLSLFGVL